MKNKNFFLLKNTLSITLLTFTLVGVTACANTHRAIDPKATVIPQKIYQAKPIKFNDGGIWPGDTAKNLLFEDTKAKQVGDIVTVVLNETATSTQSATTDTSKSSSTSLATTAVLGLPSDLGVKNFLGLGTGFDPTIGATNERANKGSGTTTRSGTLTGTISATIIAINESGNFEIEGKRSVTINHEEQVMVLTGIIRPSDVNYNNTINSSLIANASITYTGDGVIADEQRVGWLMRALSYVWPF
jgi:flagellar L-ring protein precursor FlgH